MSSPSRAKRAAIWLSSIAVLITGGAQAVRGQSALDGFDPKANGSILVVVVQPDGKILIGGNFTTLSPNGGATVVRNRIARLNQDGTLDTAFNPGANNLVYAIAVQPDGKILAGGLFTFIGGQARNRIARLDAATGAADTFNPNAGGQVRAIVVQPDGKILVGGEFVGQDTVGGQVRHNIARLDATTGLADSFNPDANNVVYSIALQADGRILAGGQFTSIGGQTRRGLARLNATTGLADSFDPNVTDHGLGIVTTIAIQADGKILAGGIFTAVGGQTRHHIARLDPRTGVADSFDPNPNGVVRSIVVQADGKILVGGRFTGANSIGGQTRNHVARLDPTTGLADSFDPNVLDPINEVSAMAVQADGKIIAGGIFTVVAPNGGAAIPRNNIARLEVDGTLDRTLNLNTVGTDVGAIALQPDGKMLIGGDFDSVLGVARNNIARLNPDGTLDLAFDPNANDTVHSIAVQADGKILVGGRFTGANSIGGQLRNNLARLDPTTGLADSFNPNPNNIVNAIVVQADGKILVGGYFFSAFFSPSIGGQPRNRLARLNPASGQADSFNPNANDGVFCIAVQPDGKILVGGSFAQQNSIGGQFRNHLARLDPTTGLADDFDPNANDAVTSIVLQADGRILAGGRFSGSNSIGGQLRNHLARLDPNTGLADSFDPNSNGVVSSIAIQADGKILVGGGFGNVGGQDRNDLARLDPTTGLADSFNPNASGWVHSIALQADGKILTGGVFTGINGQPRSLFARLSNDVAALQDLAVTQTTLTWTRGGSSAQLARVTFEYSTDNVSFTLLGNGIGVGSNWTLTGLSLPLELNVFIRARGYYHSGFDNASESMTELVRQSFLVQASQALNLSTRMRVETGESVGIGGFIITGNAPKHVLLRAIGPSLGQSGVPNVLADPVLQLHGPAGFATITNNNWRDDPAQEAAILATGIPPAHDLESAIDVTLEPGSYTAIVTGQNGSSGVGLIEVYDLTQAVPAKLANISTRAFVRTGSDIVIAGFLLGGNPSQTGDDRVIVRGIGPSLAALGVANVLADPTLELRDGNGALLIANNDWEADPAQAAELLAAGLAPTSQLESGLSAILSPGAYTALLSGVNTGTGIGLVEVFDRGAP